MFSERIRRLLKSADLTQAELARQMGISRVSVNSMVKYGHFPRDPEKLEKLAQILKTTPAYLTFGYDEDAKKSICVDDSYVLIPAFDVSAACGHNGVENQKEPLIKFFKVAREWLRTHAPYANKTSLNIITASGDSMQPTAKNGDMVVIDTSQDVVNTDSVYAFVKDGELYLKRLQRIGKGLRVISDNPIYPPFEIADNEIESVRIIGRVCTIGRFQDL